MKKLITFLALVLSLNLLYAQAGSYYTGINTSSSTFVSDLKALVRSNTKMVSYGNYDETNIANFASRDTTGGKKVVTCVYSGENYVYTPPFAWTTYSREHTFCHSWMPTYPSESGPEYCDQNHLFPTNQNSANGVRSNHPLGVVTQVQSSFLLCKYGKNSKGETVFEPRDSHKGDAARALLYMCLRYDGVDGKEWNFNYLNNTRLPSLSEAPEDLATLIAWNNQDPPNAWEIARNDYIQSIQGNRNPFIDHPEYVNYIDFNTMQYQPGGQQNLNTAVYFTVSQANVSEGAGVYNISVSITNPGSSAATNATVTLSTGDNKDINSFSQATVTFPAGSSAAQIIPVTITDDAIAESTESLTFTINNISGGVNAATGITSQFTLNILDNDAAQTAGNGVYISEYADAPGTGNYIYEFVEIYNSTNIPVSASGNILSQQNSSKSLTIPSGVTIPANGFLIIGRNAVQSAFETFWKTTLSSNVTYISSGDVCPQINGDEIYSLLDNSSKNIDPSASGEFSAVGIAASKRVFRLNHSNTATDWQSDLWSNATPGKLESNQLLPVEFISLEASPINGKVSVSWATATEVNNYGFFVERKAASSDWESVGFVRGKVSSTSVNKYNYIDNGIMNLGKYFYRIRQTDLDGSVMYSKQIEVNLQAPVSFELAQNYPNPFNPETVISYKIPFTSKVTLTLYDQLGREVSKIINGDKAPGFYQVNYNAAGLSSGIYIYRLQAGSYSASRKMILAK